MVRVWVFVIVVLAALGFAAWASDFVTMQGERTIYTVDCRGGVWKDDRCTGSLQAGLRYRYRALRPHSEVVFWTVGTSEPSGKFGDCTVKDGRNWTCKANADAPRSITLQMAEGAPVAPEGASTRPFRAVSKWRWLLLQRGWGDSIKVPPAASKPPG
jgi:hypothetical protein